MKQISRIVLVALCGVFAVLALTGCDALGIEITESGIRANSNVLILGTCAIIVILVVVQRLLDR